MRPNSRGRRALVLAVAVLAASLGAASAADAASSKRCRALAGKAKVVVKDADSIVVSRGDARDYTLSFYACLYAKPRLFKLPGQNGGSTERFARFTPQGRFLAYEHVNVEEASPFYPGYIELVDLASRKLVFRHDAFPVGPMDEETTGVSQILLRQDGAVAWIGYDKASPDNYSVQTLLSGQANPAEVDRGTDIGKNSLRRVGGNLAAFTWLRGGERKTAAFGGPTVTP
jgi:hypothetical protein